MAAYTASCLSSLPAVNSTSTASKERRGRRARTIERRLKASFDRYFEAPVEAWRGFSSLCEVIRVRKDQVLKRAGETEAFGYFILAGSGGVFLSRGRDDVCLDLMYEDMFFGDYMSLITNQPSPLETRVLEDAELLRISRANIDRLKGTPIGATIFLVSAESSFVEKQQQQVDLMSKTAEQRYDELVRRQPALLQRTAQKHVASFLGITTQSLSRIRRRRAGSMRK